MMLYDDYRTTWYRLSESHVVKRERLKLGVHRIQNSQIRPDPKPESRPDPQTLYPAGF